jgi:hypothetical protein
LVAGKQVDDIFRRIRDKILVITQRVIAPNHRTSGNGAVALWFHIGRLSRAVPECER